SSSASKCVRPSFGPCNSSGRCGKNILHFRSLHSKWALPAFFCFWDLIAMDATLTRVWQLAGPLVEGEEMEIVDMEFRHEGSRGGRVLRLYLDKEGGPNVDDLGRVSRQLSELLDAEDTIDGSYTLEVSSPGINRPLKKPAHFARFVGKRI